MNSGFALLTTALSSLLFGLSFALGAWPLAFVCLVPLLIALRSGGLARAIGLAWAWAVLSALAISSVFPASIANYFMQPQWVGWVFAIAIYSVMASLYYMLFTPIYRALASREGLWLPLAVGAAWTAAELARGRLLTGTEFLVGNPWGLMGYAVAGVAPLAQGAALFGVYGLGFAIVAVNAALVECIVSWRDPQRSRQRALRGLGVACLPIALLFAYGTVSLGSAPQLTSREGLVPVAIVQGNVSLGRRWRSDFYGENLDVYLDLTRQAFAAGKPEIVFWPEGALTFFLDAEPRYRRALGMVLSEGRAELLVGGPSGDGDTHPPFFNSVFALTSGGEVVARYDKQYLVPFSEFVPLSGFDFVRRRIDGARQLEHGSGSGILETRAGRAGLLVCNEAMLPEVASARVAEGAEYLVSPSNDSWLVGEGFAEHMLQVVSLRAIEQRRYLVRASTSGPSAVVDPWGRINVRSAPFERQIVLGLVGSSSERSVYSRIGDAFGFTCAGAVGVVLALRRRR